MPTIISVDENILTHDQILYYAFCFILGFFLVKLDIQREDKDDREQCVM